MQRRVFQTYYAVYYVKKIWCYLMQVYTEMSPAIYSCSFSTGYISFRAPSMTIGCFDVMCIV